MGIDGSITESSRLKTRMLDIEKIAYIQSFLRTDKLSLVVMSNLCCGFTQQQPSTTHSFAYALPSSGIGEELQKTPQNSWVRV